MPRLPAVVLLQMFVVAVAPASLAAQSLTDELSVLLTAQNPASASAPDTHAAQVTQNTIAQLFTTELANSPVGLSSAGFVYRLNRSLGVFERASAGFGPFFTERALRNGRGQFSVGVAYQFSGYTALQGTSLESGTFPTYAARFVGASQPFAVDTLQLSLSRRTTTASASYGVTDRLAVGGVVPFVHVRFAGVRTRQEQGASLVHVNESGSAFGLGDVSVNTRYLVAGDGPRGFSLGADVLLPTGKEEDLLGAGRTGARLLAIGSWEEGRLALNVNGGYATGGPSEQLSWALATTFALGPRATLVAEVLGSRLADVRYLQDVYQPHSLIAGVETMRWLPSDRHVVTTLIAAGAKWNVGDTWLLTTSLLFRVTDGGLRSRVTPSISFGYDFEH